MAIELKKSKLKKFMHLTALNLAFLHHPLVLGVLLAASASALLVLNSFVKGESISTLGTLALGTMIGGGAVVGSTIINWLTTQTLNKVDPTHKFKSKFFNGNHYLHELYKILSDITPTLKRIPREEHEAYLYKKRAQVLILTRMPMNLKTQDMKNFGINNAPLVRVLEQELNIPDFLLSYEKTISTRLKSPKLFEAVKKELLGQNITLLDLAYDLYSNEKHDNATKKWMPLKLTTNNATELVVNALIPICAKEQSLNKVETQQFCELLSRLKNQAQIRQTLSLVLDNIVSPQNIDLDELLKFIHNSAIVEADFSHEAMKKINMIKAKSGHVSVPLVYEEIRDNKKNELQINTNTSSNSIPPLFTLGLLDLLSPTKISEIVSPLTIEHDKKQNISAVLSNLSKELEILEKNRVLLSFENSIELKMVVNKNLPALLSYIEASSVLPKELQEKTINGVEQTLNYLSDNVKQLKETLGSNMLTDLEAMTVHMKNKNQVLRHAAR